MVHPSATASSSTKSTIHASTRACVRDFGFIVTNGKSDFFSEEKRDTDSVLESTADGVPAFTITSTCKQGRYRLRKLIFADPDRDVLLQQVTFEAPAAGTATTYRLYMLVAPHLVNRGEQQQRLGGRL